MSQPRVLLIGGNRGRWTWDEQASVMPTMNGIEAWVFATKGSYCDHTKVTMDDINSHDIVICNSNYVGKHKRMMHYVHMAEQRKSHVRWVTLLEGDMRDYMIPDHVVQRALNASTLVNCINRFATEFIRQITSAPVEYIGIPYPLEGIRSYRRTRSERERRIFLCSFLLQRWNDYAVGKQLNMPMDGFQKRLTRKLRYVRQNLRQHNTILNKDKPLEKVRSIYNDPNLTVHREQTLPNYFSMVSNTSLWINMDDRFTWGRYVLDAAALGIPIITTRSTGHGNILFPETTVASTFEIDEAVRIANRLIAEPDFYDHVTSFATERVEQYDAPHIVERLYQTLGI